MHKASTVFMNGTLGLNTKATRLTLDRLILLVPAVLCVVVVLFMGWLALIVLSQETGKNRAQRNVQAYSTMANSTYESGGLIGLVAFLEQISDPKTTSTQKPVAAHITFAQLARENGSVVFTSMPQLPDGQTGWTVWTVFDADNTTALDHKGTNAAIAHKMVLANQFALTIGQTYPRSPLFLTSGGWILIGFAITSLLLIAWILYVSQRAYVRRVERLSDTLHRVARGEQGVRVALAAPQWLGWEIDDVAARVNATLDRTEATTGAIRDWTAQAAHELRGHLGLVAEKISLIGRDQKLWAVSENLAKLSALNTVHDTLDLFDSLLDLVELRTDTDRVIGPIDMAKLFDQVHNLYALSAEESQVQMLFTNTGPQLNGEYWLILRAVSNLVENALKFAPPLSTIDVSWTTQSNNGVLAVRDQGPGAGTNNFKELLSKVTPKSDLTGHRLGLRTVEAIAIRHGAKVELDGVDEGMSIQIQFPADKLAKD